MNNLVIAVISDTHIGGMTALSLPTMTLDDGGEYVYSRAQQWIYESWLDYWNYVAMLCGIRGKRRKRSLAIIHVGDIIDGNHHRTVQALPNVIDQENMAVEMLAPVTHLADCGIYICRGTEAHAGEAAQSEVRIGQRIGSRACDWELTYNTGEFEVYATHHGGAGRKDWSSVAASLAVDVATQYARDRLPPPKYCFFGHSHIIDDSGEKLPYTRAICLPSWQLKTAYGFKIAGRKRSDIGGVILDGDTVDFKKARYYALPSERKVYHATSNRE
jgi:hypothetical protein